MAKDYYIFTYDGVAWLQADTIYHSHEDADLALVAIIKADPLIQKGVLAVSHKEGWFPSAYLTRLQDGHRVIF